MQWFGNDIRRITSINSQLNQLRAVSFIYRDPNYIFVIFISIKVRIVNVGDLCHNLNLFDPVESKIYQWLLTAFSSQEKPAVSIFLKEIGGKKENIGSPSLEGLISKRENLFVFYRLIYRINKFYPSKIFVCLQVDD